MEFPSFEEIAASFRHDEPRPNQVRLMKAMAESYPFGGLAGQLGNGEGKTDPAMALLKATYKKNGQDGSLLYMAPTKTLVRQIKKHFPDVKEVYGRNEHPCLFYKGEVNAMDSPCYVLDCPHRLVNGVTEGGAEPCPYMVQKKAAMEGGIVCCTTSFYVFDRLFVKPSTNGRASLKDPACAVFDEGHNLAETVRQSVAMDITDYHIKRGIRALKKILVSLPAENSRKTLEEFLDTLGRIAKRKSFTPTLLEDQEIAALRNILKRMDTDEMLKSLKAAVRVGGLDPEEDRTTIKALENIACYVPRYIAAMEYGLETCKRHPLNYLYAYTVREGKGKKARVKYRLCIRSFYAAGIIQKKLMAPLTMVLSANIESAPTVEDTPLGRIPIAKVFSFDTGIRLPFHTFRSEFPPENTRIFQPTDAPNLAHKKHKKSEAARARDLEKAMQMMADGCSTFLKDRHRCLVVVVSDYEKKLFIDRFSDRFSIVSYGEGKKAKTAVEEFKQGIGDVLVGTAANYSEGIDLPSGIAPVIFFLRPGYPNPSHPKTKFEERRLGKRRWAIWNWRAQIEALQTRGRNIRSAEDMGVCFFISQNFNRVLNLPEWLEPARRKKPFAECVQEAQKLLQSA